MESEGTNLSLLGPDQEVESLFSEPEMARVRAAAAREGMSVEDFVTHAARTELRRKYMLPTREGQLLTLPVRMREVT